MSMMSAPSAIMRLACASARSGARNWPPSENESGVIFSTPITAGYGPDKRAGHARRPAEAAAGTVLGELAIMRSLCAVGAGESRCEPRLARCRRSSGMIGPEGCSVSNFRRQLARLRDQLLDRLFRRQDTDEFPPDIH